MYNRNSFKSENSQKLENLISFKAPGHPAKATGSYSRTRVSHSTQSRTSMTRFASGRYGKFLNGALTSIVTKVSPPSSSAKLSESIAVKSSSSQHTHGIQWVKTGGITARSQRTTQFICPIKMKKRRETNNEHSVALAVNSCYVLKCECVMINRKSFHKQPSQISDIVTHFRLRPLQGIPR